MTAKSNAPSSPAADEIATEMSQPIIIDLGRQKASRLKDLKAGEGELWDDVLDVVDEVKVMLGDEADGKLLVPVILIYERRTSRARIEKILFPLADLDDEADDDDDDDDEDEEGEA
jgi:hypothetical protein